jgi:membrane protease YdiL (CAAX protease family)
MLVSSSGKNKKALLPVTGKKHQWWLAVLLTLWVLVGFALAQVVLIAIIWVLTTFGVSLAHVNESILNATLSACVYLLSLLVVLGVPWLWKRRRISKKDLGLQRLPSWLDIGLAPAGFVVYLVGSVVLLAVASTLVPGLDVDQIQQNGFENIGQRYEYIIAFVTLVVVAPLAEEVLFRGYLYGKLRSKVPVWAAVLLVSILFAAIHGQWNVGLDVFALSVVLCTLREITGSIWSGVLLHTLKNGVAFYFLFINPLVM